ncbi:MAG: hypothetical protein ACRC33_10760 [Gemmataceae bacterium]
MREMLTRLTDRPAPDEYRTLMVGLGEELAAVVRAKLDGPERILLVCTNEDADFLARGVLRGLERLGCTRITLACFWNDRKRLGALDVAPIVRRYVEPGTGSDVFVVVKSIISSACVVRTNISELVHDRRPGRILVAAPVILAGSTQSLEAEFDPSIARRFEYVWFAQDDEKKADGEVVPGIGGSVYELLGIGTSATKNGFTPDLVKERRSALAAPGC